MKTLGLLSWIIGNIPDVLRETEKAGMPITGKVISGIFVFMVVTIIGGGLYVKAIASEADERIEEQGQEIKTLTQTIKAQSNKSLALLTGAEIRSVAKLRCKAKDFEKEALNAKIAQLQFQYKEAAGEYFVIYDCKDL